MMRSTAFLMIAVVGCSFAQALTVTPLVDEKGTASGIRCSGKAYNMAVVIPSKFDLSAIASRVPLDYLFTKALGKPAFANEKPPLRFCVGPFFAACATPEENTPDNHIQSLLHALKSTGWTTSVEKNENIQKIVMVNEATGEDNACKLRLAFLCEANGVIQIQAVLLNTGKNALSLRMGLNMLFQVPDIAPENTFLVVPHTTSRKIGEKRINYLSTAGIKLDKLPSGYEWRRDKLSPANRWFGVGGLEGSGFLALNQGILLRSINYRRSGSYLTVTPTVRIDAAPGARQEVTATLYIGRNLEAMSKITPAGIFGYQLQSQSDLLVQFASVKKYKSVYVETTLMTEQDRMMATKSSAMLNVSLETPGTSVVKFDKLTDFRYKIKAEALDDNDDVAAEAVIGITQP